MSKTVEMAVRLTHDFGAMSRLLNTLRRRGVTIEVFQAERLSDGGYEVILKFESSSDERTVDLLAKQIRNLIDVLSVSVLGNGEMTEARTIPSPSH